MTLEADPEVEARPARRPGEKGRFLADLLVVGEAGELTRTGAREGFEEQAAKSFATGLAGQMA